MPRSVNYNDIAIMENYYRNDQHSLAYQYYADITGSSEAATQAKISNPDTIYGQIASEANKFAQDRIHRNMGEGFYPDTGLHSFSRTIADDFIGKVKANVDAGGTGVLSDDEMISAAHGVWNQRGIGEYFPGNLFEGSYFSSSAFGSYQAGVAVFGANLYSRPIEAPIASAINPEYYFGGALDFTQHGNPFTNPDDPFASSFSQNNWGLNNTPAQDSTWFDAFKSDPFMRVDSPGNPFGWSQAAPAAATPAADNSLAGTWNSDPGSWWQF